MESAARSGIVFSLICHVAVILIVIYCLIIPVAADEFIVSGEEYAGDGFDSFMDELPPEVREAIGDFSVTKTDGEENLRTHFSFAYLWKQIRRVFAEKILPFFGKCTIMCGMLLITAMTKQLTGENPFMEMCADLTMALTIYSVAAEMFAIAGSYMESLCTVMNRFLPVLAAASYSTGEITAATVQHTGMVLFITILSSINTYLFQPLCRGLFALTIIASVCNEVSVSGLLAWIKRFFLSLFSFFILIYSFVYGIQTSLAKCSDSLGLRTVRFALGNFIPIVGGVVSEAFAAVREGLRYVKTMTGIGGILVLLLLLLPVGVSLFLMQMTFSVSHLTAEVLGLSKSAKWLADTSSILQILMAMVWLSTLFFLFAMILYIKTTVHAA